MNRRDLLRNLATASLGALLPATKLPSDPVAEAEWSSRRTNYDFDHVVFVSFVHPVTGVRHTHYSRTEDAKKFSLPALERAGKTLLEAYVDHKHGVILS